MTPNPVSSARRSPERPASKPLLGLGAASLDSESIMPYARGNATPRSLEIPGFLRNLILVYLAASGAAIALLVFGGHPAAGAFLVLFALPWSLLVNDLVRHLALDSATLNLALLAVGIGVNAALLYLLGRWLQRRRSSQRTT
jgi:hypothetical protein